MVNFVIKEKIYDIPLSVVVGTYDEYTEYLNKKYKVEKTDQKYYGGQATLYTNRGAAIASIWLPQFNMGCISDIAALTHEIDHISQYIMEHFDIPILANQSNHAYIYLKAYFLYETLTKLKRLQK